MGDQVLDPQAAHGGREHLVGLAHHPAHGRRGRIRAGLAPEDLGVAGGDAGQEPAAGGAVIDVQQLVAAPVAQGQHRAHPLVGVRRDAVPCELLVGQGAVVELGEGLVAAHGAP